MKLNADQWMVMFEVEREICTCLSLCTEVHSGRDSEALQASERRMRITVHEGSANPCELSILELLEVRSDGLFR